MTEGALAVPIEEPYDLTFSTALGRRTRIASAIETWGLTARQAEVLWLAAQGDTNKDIAAELRLAEVTIENHMTALLRKAGADNRARLVAWFWTRLDA